MFDFLTLPLWANIALLAGGGTAVWLVGTRLAMIAGEITRKTKLSEAFTGLLLLGFATSLPEVATSVSSAWSGNANLATSNLLGGVSMQTSVLAVADAAGLKGALTYFTPGPVLMMQAVLVVLLLGIVVAASAVRATASVLSIGAGTMMLFLTCIVGLYVLKRYEANPRWKAINPPDELKEGHEKAEEKSRYRDTTLRALSGLFAGASLVVLAAGWLVAATADAIATQSGIGATFIGATLLATTSSLPELSTTIQAARQGAYRMAVSNIFGSNSFDVALLFVADAFYRPGPILGETPAATMFMAALGIVLTCVYLVGLLERGDRAVLRLGWDSLIVLVLYAGGLWLLYGFGATGG